MTGSVFQRRFLQPWTGVGKSWSETQDKQHTCSQGHLPAQTLKCVLNGLSKSPHRRTSLVEITAICVYPLNPTLITTRAKGVTLSKKEVLWAHRWVTALPWLETHEAGQHTEQWAAFIRGLSLLLQKRLLHADALLCNGFLAQAFKQFKQRFLWLHFYCSLLFLGD